MASTSTPNPRPLHTVAVPFNLSPGSLVSPTQVQQLITQFHSPLTTSHDLIRKPVDLNRQSRDQGTPLTVQSVTIASDKLHSSQHRDRHLTQLAGGGGIVLSPSQLQILVSQMQANQKLSEGPFQIVTALPSFNAVTTE